MREHSVYSENIRALIKLIEKEAEQGETISQWVKGTDQRPPNKKHTGFHDYLKEGGYADPKLQVVLAPFVPEAKKVVDKILKVPWGKRGLFGTMISHTPDLAVYVIAETIMLSHIYDGEYMVVPKAKVDTTKLKPGDTYWARVTVKKGKPPIIHEDDLR